MHVGGVDIIYYTCLKSVHMRLMWKSKCPSLTLPYAVYLEPLTGFVATGDDCNGGVWLQHAIVTDVVPSDVDSKRYIPLYKKYLPDTFIDSGFGVRSLPPF